MDSDKGKAGGKRAKQHQKLVVSMQPVPAPDADERLRRATDLLLQAAANASQSKKSRNSLAQHQCKRNP